MKNKIAIPFLGILLLSLVSAQNVFTEVGGKLGERVFSGILWFGVAFIIIAAVGGTMWYFLIYRRKFNITVKVNSERAADRHAIFFDKAAIIHDRKTNSKYLKFWGLKIELPVPPYGVLQNTDKGDYLEIKRTAEDRFYYLLPPYISKKYLMKSDGRVYPFAEQKTKMLDPDMAFWSAKRKDKNKSMFDPESTWMKLIPYIPIVMGGAIMIFILYILMSYLPAIIAELHQLAQTLNQRTAADITQGLTWTLIK